MARPTAENAVPPTSWLVLVTPGISTPIWPVDFMPAGIALITSRVMTRCCTTFWMSTVGDCAGDGDRFRRARPTRRSAFTVAVKDDGQLDALALDGVEARSA